MDFWYIAIQIRLLCLSLNNIDDYQLEKWND
jgi:hypothetical protein